MENITMKLVIQHEKNSNNRYVMKYKELLE